MGVMSCSRKDCENIMCHTYVNDIGYICSDCQREFEEIMGDQQLSGTKMAEELEIFMKTSATHRNIAGSNEPITARELFNRYKKE